jgi:hypothetical protein
MSKDRPKRAQLDLNAAETIAVQALGYLAGEPQHFARFLQLTGLTLDELRRQAGSPELLAAVLAHLAGDESLLLAFAADARIAPESIIPALALLQGLPRE